MPDSAPSHRRVDRTWLLAVALALLTILVLASTVLLGALLTLQTQTLGESVEQSQYLVNANVRALSQAQREILRLITLLGRDDVTGEQIDLQRAFIGQRTQESSLPYQVYTLGSEALLAESRNLREQWLNRIEPLVLEIVSAPGSASDELRGEATDALRSLELGYNQLISDSEANRRLQGAELNAVARSNLASTWTLLVVLTVSAVAFLCLGGVTVFSFWRLSSQREQAVQALVQANVELRKLSAVASLTRNLVVVTDAQGQVEWVNNAFVANTGYSLAEVRGKHPGHLLQGEKSDPATVAAMRQHLQAGESFEAELVNYAKNGREYWIAIEAQPTFDAAGRLVNFVAIETDITARKEAEAALRTALEHERELRDLKSRLVTMTSHEFRTPLTTILSLASFLKMADNTLTADKRIERLTKIEVAARHISALLDDVLLYDQTDEAWLKFAPVPVDLVAMTEEVVDHMRVGAGGRHPIQCALPGEPLILPADARLLRQILSNLLSNAVKYSPAGAPIEVVVRRDGERALVRVTDHGIGIPAAEQRHIFEPFHRAANTGGIAGTGLGLAITRNAVELHGGQIRFESAEGEGATFTVLLPAEPLPELAS